MATDSHSETLTDWSVIRRLYALGFARPLPYTIMMTLMLAMSGVSFIFAWLSWDLMESLGLLLGGNHVTGSMSPEKLAEVYASGWQAAWSFSAPLVASSQQLQRMRPQSWP